MSFFDRLVKISQKHMKDQANFQNMCGTAALLLSCAAFTCSVGFNKGIPAEQKKFLVSQELADGAINVTLFWVMTDKFKKWADKKIATGNIFPKEMKEKVQQIREKVGANATMKEMSAHFTEEELSRVGKFHSGFKNVVSLVGSVVAASIITPVIRNIIASNFQKKVKFEKKEVAPVKPQTTLKPYTNNKVMYKTQSFNSGIKI